MKCLKKLAQQELQKKYYEVIVVTDGPDTETQSAVNLAFRQDVFFNIFCYCLDRKKGPAAARNKGAFSAKGKLIVFTDDDCLPQPDWLNEYLLFYESIAETAAAFTGRTIVPRSGRPTDYENNIANLETAEFITANCALTKTAFNTLNGFDEDFPIAWREDSDMHFRLVKNNIPIYAVKNAVVVHPVRIAAWGVSIKEQKKSLFNALLYKKHTRLYKEKIRAKPLWDYYIMILLFCIFITGTFTAHAAAGIVALAGWLFFFARFVMRRLRSTTKRVSHVMEMMVTSALIPFLSIYWTLYGSVKYRTLFL